MRRSVQAGEPLSYVASVVMQPPWAVRAGALGTVVLLFAGLRGPLGNAIQRRCFTTVDFAEVSLRDVRGALHRRLDRGPAVFVETIVRPMSRPAALQTSAAGATRVNR